MGGDRFREGPSINIFFRTLHHPQSHAFVPSRRLEEEAGSVERHVGRCGEAGHDGVVVRGRGGRRREVRHRSDEMREEALATFAFRGEQNRDRSC